MQLEWMLADQAWLQDVLSQRREIAAFFEAQGLGWVWRLIHYLTDAKTWLLCILPVLVLQTLLPARPLDRSYWRSFVHDWAYPFFAIAIASHFVVPMVSFIYDVGRSLWPDGPGSSVREWPGVLQFLLAFLIQDFLRYVSHYLRHKVRWLWYFHAIHHSQVHLNPVTTHRTHVFEAFVSATLMTLPIGLIGIEPTPWIYAGITSLFWDHFIHSNARINLGPLGRVLVSPQYHRVHHSALPEHFDMNFSERLTLWDHLFGTACPDRAVYPPTGCPESRELMEVSASPWSLFSNWIRHFLFPFKQILRNGFSRGAGGPGEAA